MNPDKITVHMSYTPVSMDIGVKEIRDWHVNGNGWNDVGYHYVIRRGGQIEEGRPLDRMGAHVGGHNANNIGICLVGGKKGSTHDFNFTHNQMTSLYKLVIDLKDRFDITNVKGHRDYAPRGCPGFNVQAFFGE